MEGELPPHHPAYISTQMKLMEESRSQGKWMSHVSPYNNMPPANTASPSTAETHPSRIRYLLCRSVLSKLFISE